MCQKGRNYAAFLRGRHNFGTISSMILEELFGSRARVRLMRLFLLNRGLYFDTKTLVQRTQESDYDVKFDVAALARAQFIKKGMFTKPKSKGKGKIRISGWTLNEKFPYLQLFEQLLIAGAGAPKDEIATRFKKAGQIKLIVLSGIFIKKTDSKVDILLVGDGLRRGQIERTLKVLEAEIGKELTYAIFDTKDFKYRMGMYDKFIRDILDFPHEKIVDKIGLLYR